ncbi:phosphohydrolase [Treponema sp.]|uniref:phosphohydrolase n=1 Tax=Treponema sp. TaxID=166 RepID=UPI0025EE4810|nr:phosphohydrolase [Treponema sp.]MCR5217080.1 phosphohydrolase [Treponema sp.]
MKSPKEININDKLLTITKQIVNLDPSGDQLPLQIMEILVNDEEIQHIQDYANTVSIVRLGFNDHGPVHMRTVCRNSLKMLKILHEAGIQTSLEKEQTGTFLDSVSAVIIASFMHDFGMTLGRQDHELYSGIIAFEIINRILNKVLPEEKDLKRKVVIRSLALEGIIGHMGTRRIHSIEAGIILIADGCDMTKGRARIPMELNRTPSVGDIHKYSANSIEKVQIIPGQEKPVRIEVNMSADVGFFQIEEVLLQKINCSPAKSLVELYAGVDGAELKKYL